MSYVVRTFAVAGALGFLMGGCGGGGGGGGAAAGLSGKMTVTSFLIPAGTTKTVSGDLTIHATQSVEIDGSLIIPPGFNVTIVSDGSFFNNGLIGTPLIAAESSRRASAVERGTPTNLVFGAGGTSTTELGTISAPANSNVFITGSNFNTLISAQRITTPSGVAGKDSNTPGANSGRIEIGSQQALQLAKNAGGSGLGTPTNIVIGTLTTGDGGDGFEDTVGVGGGNLQTMTGSNGGNAGDIVINATGILTIKTCYTGNGGHGGGASYKFTGVAAASSKGGSIVANIGGGGSGGNINITPALPTAEAGTAGLAGSTGKGALTFVAQDGGSNGGAGGDITIISGSPGTNGTGPTLANPYAMPNYTVTPGKGQYASDYNHAGGTGGLVTMKTVSGGPVTKASITINPGAGGSGYSAVCGLNSTSPGTNGGNGSVVTVNGSAYTAGPAANGGYGGSGTSAGTGGNAAVDDAGKLLGKPGPAGTHCSGQGASLFNTVPVPGSPSFCFFDSTSDNLFCSAAELSQSKFSYLNTVSLVSGQWGSLASLPDNQNNLTLNTMTQRGNGVIYLASTDHTIQMISDVDGSQLGSISVPNQTNGPSAIGFEATTGRLYVSVDQGVDVFDTLHNNTLIGIIQSTVADASAMAINPNNHRLYLLKPTITFNAGTVSVMNTSSLTEITQIPLPDYSGVIALDPVTGNVFSSLYNQGKIVEISPTTNAIVNTVSVGSNPWGVECDSTRGRVYVVNYNYSSTKPQAGSLTELSESNLSTITTVTLGKGPTGLAIDEPNDKLYVANALDNSVSILNGN